MKVTVSNTRNGINKNARTNSLVDNANIIKNGNNMPKIIKKGADIPEKVIRKSLRHLAFLNTFIFFSCNHLNKIIPSVNSV